MRIGIHGPGVVFPGGVGRDALLRSLESGVSLLAPGRLDPSLIAAQIQEDLKPLIKRRGLAALSRSALLAAAAIENLIESELAAVSRVDPRTCGLVVGTAFGHLESKAAFCAEARKSGARLVSPIVFPNTIVNSLAGHAAILFGWSGPNSTVTSGRRSGLEALVRARTLLETGRADCVVVVGCDEVSLALALALRAVPGSPRPGEAAVALLLRGLRGAEAPSEGLLLGAGEVTTVRRTCRQAAREAIAAALGEAALQPDQVRWVSLSAGGSQHLDAQEAQAIADVFRSTPVASAPKFLVGECFGAAGPLALAAAMLSARRGFVPATPITDELSQLFPGLAGQPRKVEPGPVLVTAVDEEGATAILWGPG